MKNKVDYYIKIHSELQDLRQSVTEMNRLQEKAGGVGHLFKQGLFIDVAHRAMNGLMGTMASVVTTGISYNAMLEDASVAYQTLLGDIEAVEERMESLEKFASTTPFQFDEIVRADKHLQVFTEGAMNSEETLRMVGDAAAVSGQGFSDVAFWVGRLYSGLKNGQPIGEASMRLQEMGVLSGEAKMRIDAMSGSVQDSNTIMQELGSAFDSVGGAMELKSQTLNGLWSTMKDTLASLAGVGLNDGFINIKDTLEYWLEVLGALPDAMDKVQKKWAEFGEGYTDKLKGVGSEGHAYALSQEIDKELQRLEILRESNASTATAKGTDSDYAEQLRLENQLIYDQERQLAMMQLALARDTQGIIERNKQREAELATEKEQERVKQLNAKWENELNAAQEKNAKLMPDNEKELELLKEQCDVVLDELEANLALASSEEARNSLNIQAQNKLIELSNEILKVEKAINDEKDEKLKKVQTEAEYMASMGYDRSRDGTGWVERDNSRLGAARNRVTGQTVYERDENGSISEKKDADGNIATQGGLSDPSEHYQSADEGMMGGMYELADQLGTVGDAVNDTFLNIANSGLQSVSDGLYDVITQGGELDDIVSNLAENTLRAVIDGIVQMGAQWIIQKTIMAGADAAFAATSAATQVGVAAGTATVLAGIWAAPATLATIATLGAAAAQAPVSITGATSAVKMMGMAGFAKGGEIRGPGTRTSDSIPIWASDEEIMINAHDAQKNRAFLLGINAGRSPEEMMGMSVPSSIGSASAERLQSASNGLAEARKSSSQSNSSDPFANSDPFGGKQQINMLVDNRNIGEAMELDPTVEVQWQDTAKRKAYAV